MLLYRRFIHSLSINLIVLITTFSCCKKEKSVRENFNFKNELLTHYPKFSIPANTNLITITSESHRFSENIVFKKVLVFFDKITNSYSFIWVIDDGKTDFEELLKWKIGMILKPMSKLDFKDPILKKKGIKTMGVLIKPVIIGDDICIVLKNFKLFPKDFEYVKFYLYNNTGEVNLNYWTKKDVILK